MRNTLLAIAAASMPLTAMTAVWTPAEARHKERRYYTSENNVRYWRGNDGRYHCKRSNGTTGLIVGAAAGALAGRAIDTRGERATGTILGAAAGALLGREVARGPVRCR
jgi:outer membrane lipoprotein SlyB